MFTGIIQAIGKVVKYDGNRLWVTVPFTKVIFGESISVDGVCLTVAAKKGRLLAFDVGRETQRLTTLGDLAERSRVNVERALRVGDRLGGHWVSGHIDETGRVIKIEKAKQSWGITISVPKALRRYVVTKGSLALDGVSLTVAAIRGGHATVMIIPYTLSHTTLGDKKEGSRVNIETDLVGKYALR